MTTVLLHRLGHLATPLLERPTGRVRPCLAPHTQRTCGSEETA
jgi:hypothetical protein